MGRIAEPFTIAKRADSDTYHITLNPSCGLPVRVCNEWRRKSFKYFPDELADFRFPKSIKAAKPGAWALIAYLKKKLEEEGSARRVPVIDVTVGEWIKKFIELETSPRTGINAGENRPYSLNTLDSYKSYFNCHIKDDPICQLKMTEVEEEDVLEYISRLSIKKFSRKNGTLGGSRTFSAVIVFMRLAFNEYQRKVKRWYNPFQFKKAPKCNRQSWDALTEDEVVKLFQPGVLLDILDLCLCASMFLSGLRRGEIPALRPEFLDWHTPKIRVSNAWQRLDKKDKVLGPPKGKKTRDAPFDPILQDAIRKLWAENGQHEYVFIIKRKNGTLKTVGPALVQKRFKKWLARAGIELKGRRIVPHSSRHSLASMLEARGVSLRYIQDLLGHSNMKTTKIYLHSTEKTIREIGHKITEAIEAKPEKPQEQKPKENKILKFKAS
ncbi:MAG: tyrosine-type recombinase/integrase [Treponema sp.]|nr:tyrosine-type recombinase/integrase [Treponema sp.]MCL2245114.1 tyrosine-type recombinase/integrase [Treponema sp.]